MAFWGLENFVFGNVSGAFTTGQLTLNMAVGHTARFTIFPMRAVLWNFTDFSNPAEAFWSGAAEIVTIVSKSGDTFNSILRGQEGTSAISSDGSKVYRIAPVLTRGGADKIMRAPPDGSDSFDAIRSGTPAAVAAALARLVYDDGATSHKAIHSVQGGPRSGQSTELWLGDTADPDELILLREVVAGKRARLNYNALDILSIEGNGAVAFHAASSPAADAQVYFEKMVSLNGLYGGVEKTATISADAITALSNHIKVAAESGGVDDLVTINATLPAGGTSPILILRRSGSDVITIKETGNIDLALGEYKLNSDFKYIAFIEQAGDWREIYRVPTENYVLITDQKAQNTAGGTFTSGAWRTRDLNTENFDTEALASIASNQFTLQPGVWRIRASAPAFNVGRHQIRLQNITDTSTDATGSSEASASAAQTRSFLETRINIGTAKTFEIQHQGAATVATNGFGVASNFTVEIYTIVQAWMRKGR